MGRHAAVVPPVPVDAALSAAADVRVVSGEPSPEELAAVIAVLQRPVRLGVVLVHHDHHRSLETGETRRVLRGDPEDLSGRRTIGNFEGFDRGTSEPLKNGQPGRKARGPQLRARRH